MSRVIPLLTPHLNHAVKQSWARTLQCLTVTIAVVSLWLGSSILSTPAAQAYPFWAQELYSSPREATGRIVCANCHLAQKPVEIEVPQAVLPNTIFAAKVKIPYDHSIEEVYSDGSTGGLAIGAVIVLPDGFKLAPFEDIPEELMEEVGDFYYYVTPYSEEQDNILLAGPLVGEDFEELVFPLLSPDPATDSSVHFGKYSIHLGGNRGRGQVYPTGDKSNNTTYNASATGTITDITDNGYGFDVTIVSEDGTEVVDSIPPGPALLVAVGDTVAKDEIITTDPNVGGFGQKDTEIVLQSPNRIRGLLAFFGAVVIAQIFLVLKKRQIEKVQLAEMSF